MEDIELVIKMPEEMYKHIMSMQFMIPGIRNGKSLLEEILKAIRTGTPLPKGHGDLVDVEEVKEYLDNIQQELDGWGETDNAIEIAKARMGLDSVSTIIEADKE